MEFSDRILEQVAFPFSRDLPNPGIKPRSPTWQVDSLLAELPGKPIMRVYLAHTVKYRELGKVFLSIV